MEATTTVASKTAQRLQLAMNTGTTPLTYKQTILERFAYYHSNRFQSALNIEMRPLYMLTALALHNMVDGIIGFNAPLDML